MSTFKILVDADGCPVKEIVAHVAKTYEIEVIFLCDLNHEFEVSYGSVHKVTPGRDAVDFAMIGKVKRGDIVVTQDYGVAAMALGKGAYALNQNGKHYTNENIDQMLVERHIKKTARRQGKHFKGGCAKKRTDEQDMQFEYQLKKMILRIMGH
ncbi:YaiI/YqxD family protein [Cellulosilyticum ruminicola]|uniref:YaiI/YqxD family protein n=1 Tax=Cellulosilyticum ruminicola TaxID=425254 RepID=UPI0006D1DD32|nr:YaiI/YqxD family protein [Cellulosilyticum ruminicola]